MLIFMLILLILLIPFSWRIQNEALNKESNADYLKNKKIFPERIKWTFRYLRISLCLFIIVVIAKIMQKFSFFKEYEVYIKLLFCFASISFGFYLKAYSARGSKVQPYPPYVIYYPCLLFAFSLLAFIGILIFLHNRTFSSPGFLSTELLFYSLAFSINVLLAFFVDSIPSLK